MALPVNEVVSSRNASHVAPASKDVSAPQAASEARFRQVEPYALLMARILISQIFIMSGVGKVMDPAGTAAEMEGRGMFWVPFFLWSAAAVEIGAGLSVLLGYKLRLGALALFLFLIPVTLTFHNFWTYPPDEQKLQMIMFMHNLTLMGGLLLLMTFGPGRLSVDGWRSATL